MRAAGLVHVNLKINRADRTLDLEPRAVLLDVLRERLGLTGAKKGCDHGQCGACTILVNGRRIKSCLTLAVMHDGDEITTIEGLEQPGALHPMQAAFLEHDGFQCGYCTPGQIMSAVGLAREPIGAGDAAVREAMSGNLCRCGAYQNICAAVQAARAKAGYMRAFEFHRARSVADAIAAHDAAPATAFVAGGTTLIDLVKLDVMQPGRVVDLNRLPLARIEPLADGGLQIGALVRNSDLAWHADVQARYPVLSTAILSGATGQLRNMATTAGNLMQRTRCPYFRDGISACNKRAPASGCAALEGFNRSHALLGTSAACIATHPSDMCVALAVLDASVVVQGAGGERTIPLREFHLLPGETPEREHALGPGELITAVTLPPPPAGARQHYLKLRDRESFEFALASAAVVVTVDGHTIREARVAFGGIATKPWRSAAAEDALRGALANDATFERAAEAALRDAQPRKHNAFKATLARQALCRALAEATA